MTDFFLRKVFSNGSQKPSIEEGQANIDNLSEDKKFICTSFRNMKKGEPLTNFSVSLRSERMAVHFTGSCHCFSKIC
jgi:hypothetical protein